MSTRDPETGQFVSSDGTDADYSDFRYQFANMEVVANDANGNVRIKTGAEYEPLEGIGGLDVNEVAELVYFELQASVEPEDEKGDQTRSTAAEFRGAFSINIAPEESQADGDGFLTGEAITDPPGSERNASANVIRETGVDDRVLQTYMVRAVPPFDDSGIETTQTGVSGGSLDGGQYYEKNFRQLTGRGPVVDSTDSLSLGGTLIAGDLVAGLIGSVRVHMVWDVAEVDDAGRAFSVPTDD